MANIPQRRAKGSGSVRERPTGSGRWQIRFKGSPGPDGFPTVQTETFKGSRRQADRRLRELVTMVESGNYAEKSQETVSEFLDRWLTTYVASNTAPSTQRGYEAVARRYINPTFGATPIQSLQPHQIQAMYAALLARGLSATTVLHTHRVLREALQHAIKWSLLTRNPADATDPPRPERHEMKMWDVATIRQFLDASSDNSYGAVYHLAVLTGMRRSELLGLQWKDIDMDNANLHVQRSLQRINGRGLVVSQTKTQKSRRAIALGTSTVDVLRGVRKKQLERRLSAGPVWNDQDFVFTQANGRPLHPDKVSNEFHRIVEGSKLPHLTLHGLRHAHATLMLAKGVHPKVVSERLGHSNVSITLDVYSHLLPGLQEAAAQAVDDTLSAGVPG